MTKDETINTSEHIKEEQPIAEQEEDEEEEDEEDQVDREKIKILPQATSEDGTSASFQILEEDHTLGNPLRYIIMKNPQVEFCGYSIPHPSENLLNIRIQTYGDITAVEALQKGLTDLMDLCDVVEEKFTDKIKQL
ncbi:similar to Saccharomyces cerevisiae YNL113W RPC19 RNA polymerase subunit AC19, common to RNA polymerases I and III [Maudiozyma barnettii]|uniref:Similar to Saccharomyces cerevisiae YNL113W RPC19 RNA polymerase subunit AC19, common to RNA polymerases I and III n=1 Tax=Maudiozyma barnettii TaxID=61262 RepID=A0A8H2VC28_9SACH|nr:DNA-directed RNA polymerase core subunit RPC19 [Kazachstania barnettii]CAB4252498.1 similar to Saccharomyces cerevisiae YNL113W RPC19 RNA polymerase subunit AC19, common to RNA polymerases I and III [Kazachstania barnettii]CAD1779232.1 similar to Saccharomyces cerevisiae YNL113W RPC19 RNA polymerase subunit AC19, common to RNA polymerases I and III [Kazachstania barnettii]